jgi:hypothetical protein
VSKISSRLSVIGSKLAVSVSLKPPSGSMRNQGSPPSGDGETRKRASFVMSALALRQILMSRLVGGPEPHGLPPGHRLTANVSTQDKGHYSALSGDVAVDVVVTPAELQPAVTWTLSDRLGRPLGTITQAFPSLFVIHAHRDTQLSGMDTANFPSLDDTMTAIARHMKGECQLASGAQ